MSELFNDIQLWQPGVSSCNEYVLSTGLDRVSAKTRALPPSPGSDPNVLLSDSHFLYFKVIASPYFDILILRIGSMHYSL